MRFLMACVLALAAGGSAGRAAPATAQATQAPVPTMDQIQKHFDGGDYRGTLAEVSKALSLRGQAAEGLDKYDLIVMRGECELRMKQAEPAAASFHQAIRQTKDEQQAADARATELLIRKSRQLVYTPRVLGKGEKSEPIDIVDPKSRKSALRALYTDELAQVTPRIDAARKGASLTVIAQAARSIKDHELATLDRAAHGTVDDTRKTVSDLKDRVQELTSKALEKLARRTDEISAMANETIRTEAPVRQGGGGIGQQEFIRRRGLTGQDSQELRSIIQTTGQIAAATQELVSALGEKSDADDLLEQANEVRQRADKALRADYGRF